MKPFPGTGGATGLNVSLHLILLSLALIAGFFLIFRELRRVEFDLHDALSQHAAASSAAITAAANQNQVFRFSPAFVPTLPTTIPPTAVDLSPVPEAEAEDEDEAEQEQLDRLPSDSDKVEEEADQLATLPDETLMTRPASELREYLRKRDASVHGNKQDLVKRIVGLRITA